MAIVQPKSMKARLFATHFFLIVFCALIMFPLLMILGSHFARVTWHWGKLSQAKFH